MTEEKGATIWVWLWTTYYDGLWQFAEGCYQGQGPVTWCDRELPCVGGTSNG